MKLLKKTILFILTMSMIVSLFTITAQASEDGDDVSVKNVTVRIEVPDKTLIYPKAVTVHHFSLGAYSANGLNDHCTVLHALLTVLGKDNIGKDIIVDPYNGTIKKIFGYEANDNYDWYFGNGSTINSNVEEIYDGSSLVFCYANKKDNFSRFSKEHIVTSVGKNVSVNLWINEKNNTQNANILVSKAGEKDATIDTLMYTNKSGSATLTFGSPGTYVLSAKRYDASTGSNITRPRMTVTVQGKAASITPTILTNAGGSAILGADAKTISIKPVYGFCIGDVKINGTSIGAMDSYTLADSEKTATILVTFKRINDSMKSVNVNNFMDVKNHWGYHAIQYVLDNHLFYGTSDTTFSPNKTVTRGMFITILGRFAKVSREDGSTIFSDIDANDYYAPYIAWANENGIISGYSGDSFPANKPITREETMGILYKYASFMGLDVSNTKGDAIKDFWDYDMISDETKAPISFGLNAHILSGRGDGSFDPEGKLTRAEVATIFEKFNEYIKKEGK